MLPNNILSVIIPMYNSQNYITKCLESVIAINISKEIIVVDDGSTDNSCNVVKPYADNGLIKLYKQVNTGVSEARNLGLSVCMGDIIAFVDSDDYVNFPEFERFYNEFVIAEADIAVGNINVLSPNKTKKLYSPENKHRAKLRGQDYFSESLKNDYFVPLVFNYLFRRKFIQDNKLLFSHKMSEDDLWTTCSMCLANEIYVSSQVHYNYCIHNESLTGRNKDSSFKAVNLLAVAADLLTFVNHNTLDINTIIWIYCKILYIYSEAFRIMKLTKEIHYNFNYEEITNITKQVLSYTDIKAKRLALTYYMRIQDFL